MNLFSGTARRLYSSVASPPVAACLSFCVSVLTPCVCVCVKSGRLDAWADDDGSVREGRERGREEG